MDEDIFSDLCVLNSKKTYSKPFKSLLRDTPQPDNAKRIFKTAEKTYELGEPLSTKTAVEYLLDGKLKSAVCRYCLNVSPGLSELDQVMQFAGTGSLYKVTIRQMIACFYPFKQNQDENFPEKICQKCLDKAISAYLFTQQCEQAERALLFCFDDMYEKLEKLDPIDRPKKRGRQKLNPNYNVLYAEHKKVIDYAEPIRNLVNAEAEPLTKEPDWNEFECKRCWQVFTNLESLLNHEKIHPKYMWYNCRLCGKSFVKINQLRKHYNKVHVQGKDTELQVDKTFKCRECGNVTDNYIQHLQHIEKHKFKSIMEHLIEKKTDKLCMVCLNKSTDLVELDKMVCIHGGYPEMTGDKTLYSVLASTLPDQKSYKYQELHVPHKAKIMSISKRKRKSDNIQGTKKTRTIPVQSKQLQFTFSSPILISRNKFKTNDFYYYVFCEPETEINLNKIDSRPGIKDTEDPEIMAVTDESSFLKIDAIPSTSKDRMDVIQISNPKHRILHSNYDTPDIVMVTNDEEPNNCTAFREDKAPIEGNLDELNLIDGKKSMILNYLSDSVKENQTINNMNEGENITTKNQSIVPNMFQFTNPLLIEDNKHHKNKDHISESKNSNALNKILIFDFSYPSHDSKTNYNETHDIEQNEEIIKPHDNILPIKEITKQKWIFSAVSKKNDPLECNKITQNYSNNIVEPAVKELSCKMCWIFKYSKKCENCKISTDNLDDRQNIHEDNIDGKNIETSPEKLNENNKQLMKDVTDTKEHTTEKTWQCKICLTNNTIDKFVCNCCESKKYIENGSLKIVFGTQNAFLEATQDQENIVKDIALPNIKTVSVVVEEGSIMDFKSVNEQENIFIQTANIKDISTTQSMDIENDTSFNLLDTKASLKDYEEMDVEENPLTPTIIHDFNPLVHTPDTSILPYIGNSVQFNIGTTVFGKGPKKPKRPLRNIPKAFHK